MSKLTSWMSLCVSLFIGTFSYIPSINAHASDSLKVTAETFDTKLLELNQKLVAAKETKDNLMRYVICLEARNKALEMLRDKKELALGQKRIEEGKLKAKFEQKKQEHEGFRKAFIKDQAEYEKAKGELDRVRRQMRAQQRGVERCERRLGRLLKGLCKVGQDIKKAFGLLPKLEKKIPGLSRRMRIARDKAEASENEYQKARIELNRTHLAIEILVGEVDNLELSLVDLKIYLGSVRSLVQPFNIGIDRFDKAVMEARKIDTESKRASALRQLGILVSEIDADIKKANSVIDALDKVVTEEGWSTSCRG